MAKTMNRARMARSAWLTTSALAALLTAQPLLAQDSEDGQGAQPAASATPNETIATDDGTIIVTAPNYVPLGAVTANKTDIPLIETPQSVSVITRDQIDLLNFLDVQQAVRYTAGVFGENYGPDLRYDFVTVRGFTPKQYIDGLQAPISTTIYSVGLDLYAFQSVDILKGPASVLYGNAPPGGIYNSVTRRPADEFGGEVGVQYGTDDFRRIFGTVTGPATDSINVRLTALGLDRESGRDLVTAWRMLLSPAVEFKLGPDTSLTALGYYQHDEVHGDTNGFLPVYGTLLPNPIGKIRRGTNLGERENKQDRSQYAIGYEFTHDFGALAFTSNTKYFWYKEATPYGVYGGGGLINITDPTDPSYYRTVSRFNFTYREEVKSFATDNRLSAEFGTGALEHKLLAGIDFRHVTNFAEFGFGGATNIDLFDPVYGQNDIAAPPYGVSFGFPVDPFNNQRLRQTGVYAQDQIRFGDLYLTLGGRYDWVNIRNRTNDQVTKQDKFTYRAGANYIFANGIAPYVSYARSFEPVIGTDSVTGETFKPSTGEQIEGGVKYDARGLGPDFKLFATAALFQIKQNNIVTTTPSVTPVFGTQTGKVEVWGGEIELVARIREQLSINGSYSYNKSKVLESATPEEVGAPLPTTPKHKLSLLVDYTLQQGPLAGLGAGIGGRYHSKSAGSLPGPFNPVVYFGESSTLFDAIIHYDQPGWRFSINGSNIFDKRYVARCASAAGCNFGAERQIIATVTAKF